MTLSSERQEALLNISRSSNFINCFLEAAVGLEWSWELEASSTQLLTSLFTRKLPESCRHHLLFRHVTYVGVLLKLRAPAGAHRPRLHDR